jgi:hypothetical protein
MGALAATAEVRALGDLRDELTLLLSSDRSSYYIGEPVRLTLTARNHSDQAIKGYSGLDQEGHVNLFYRGVGEQFRLLRRRRETPHNVVSSPWMLGSFEERGSTAIILLDQSATRLLLDHPGEYEFYVEAHHSPTQRDRVVRSETIRLGMSPPPQSHRRAYDEYIARGLGRLVAGVAPISDAEASRSAMAFLDKYPSGPYSDHVRAGLVTFLRFRMTRHLASSEEEDLYRQLRREQASPR